MGTERQERVQQTPRECFLGSDRRVDARIQYYELGCRPDVQILSMLEVTLASIRASGSPKTQSYWY